jgi:hypothetical protein
MPAMRPQVDICTACQQRPVADVIEWISRKQPQPILTNRHQITEPESLGVRLSAGNGNEALVVIWRGGWATSTYWPSAT